MNRRAFADWLVLPPDQWVASSFGLAGHLILCRFAVPMSVLWAILSRHAPLHLAVVVYDLFR